MFTNCLCSDLQVTNKLGTPTPTTNSDEGLYEKTQFCGLILRQRQSATRGISRNIRASGTSSQTNKWSFPEMLARVLEQLARAHRKTMITNGCCPKVIDMLKGEENGKGVGPSRVPIQIRETTNGGILLAIVTEAEVTLQ
ncbi:hypothetical protein Tco_0321726 [Tanacetum coccineum]